MHVKLLQLARPKAASLSEMASVHWAKQAKGWNVESSQTLHLKKGGAKHTRP